MHGETGTPSAAPSYRLFIAGVAFLWTLALAGSLWWNISHLREATLQAAQIQAHVVFKGDILFRQWNAGHGGVYVPVTEATRPDPHLDLPKHDLTLPSGEALTLLSPHSMMRQVYELAEKESGVRGHLTSLKPLRPGNAPDAWEAEALRSFEAGRSDEASSIEVLGGQPYMRLMLPFRTEKPCLACHAAQGYKEGDIRGGISVSIPLAPLWALEGKRQQVLILSYGLLWVVGLGGVALVSQRLRRKEGEREAATAALQESETRFRSVAQSATDAIVSADQAGQIIFLNRGAQVIFGYQEDEVLGKPLTVLIPERYREAHRAEIERLQTTGQPRTVGTEIELFGLRKDGHEFPLELSLALWQMGKDTFYTAIIHDITARKRAEHVLATRMQQLEAVRVVSIEVTRELDLDALLDLITKRSAELMGAASGAVALWDEGAQVLVPKAWHGHGNWFATVRWRLDEGVMGTVAQRREGLIVNDYQASSCAYPLFVTQTAISAVLAEPLLYRDRLLGVVSADIHGGARVFTEEDRQLLALFAAQAAIAIENARLFEVAQNELAERKTAETALASRMQQLAALRAVSAEITCELGLSALLQLITDRMAELVAGGQSMIRLWDEDGQWLVPRAYTGSGAHWADRRLRLGEGVAGTAAQRRQGLIVNDFRVSPYAIPLLLEGTTHTAVLALPLLFGDRLVGVISIEREADQQPFTEKDQQLLALFATQAAIAIENARLHEEVTQHATTLETRVRERTTELARINLELTDALRQAEAGNQAKNDFLINMSHELRTPLNAVLGFAQLLREQAKEGFTDKQRRYLDNIYNSGQHLLALVNEILDMDTVERGGLTLDLTAVNLADVITEALDATREAARQKNHSVHALIPPDLPVVTADRGRVRQIVVNLLSNAVKFTPDGGTITVAARMAKGVRLFDGSAVPEPPNRRTVEPSNAFQPAMLEIAVTDTGIGIRAEELPRLFRMFSQLESPLTKRYEGTGVGLVLAKRLVELHGGTITASSEGEGKGSTFTVRLPVEQGE